VGQRWAGNPVVHFTARDEVKHTPDRAIFGAAVRFELPGSDELKVMREKSLVLFMPFGQVADYLVNVRHQGSRIREDGGVELLQQEVGAFRGTDVIGMVNMPVVDGDDLFDLGGDPEFVDQGQHIPHVDIA
jgi:hypothetical protein